MGEWCAATKGVGLRHLTVRARTTGLIAVVNYAVTDARRNDREQLTLPLQMTLICDKRAEVLRPQGEGGPLQGHPLIAQVAGDHGGSDAALAFLLIEWLNAMIRLILVPR